MTSQRPDILKPSHWGVRIPTWEFGQDTTESLSPVRLFVTPWTVAYQAPLSMGFSRQECWSGLPFPSPGDLLTQESHPGLLHCSRHFTVWATREARRGDTNIQTSNTCYDMYDNYYMYSMHINDAEAPILWPSDAKSWLIEKDPDTGKDQGPKEKVVTEGKVVGWHHQHNGHETEKIPGDKEGQGSLAYCSPWDRQESDMT